MLYITAVPVYLVLLLLLHNHATLVLIGWQSKYENYISILPYDVKRCKRRLTRAEVKLKWPELNSIKHGQGKLYH